MAFAERAQDAVDVDRGQAQRVGERNSADRYVRAAVYVSALSATTNQAEAVAGLFGVIRNVSVPFGTSEPGQPNIAPTVFRTMIDVSSQRYYFESTSAPNVVWNDYGTLDFTAGGPELGLRVEGEIMNLTGNVTDRLAPGDPFVVGPAE